MDFIFNVFLSIDITQLQVDVPSYYKVCECCKLAYEPEKVVSLTYECGDTFQFSQYCALQQKTCYIHGSPLEYESLKYFNTVSKSLFEK